MAQFFNKRGARGSIFSKHGGPLQLEELKACQINSSVEPFLKKCAIPGLFSFIFRLFKQTLQF